MRNFLPHLNESIRAFCKNTENRENGSERLLGHLGFWDRLQLFFFFILVLSRCQRVDAFLSLRYPSFDFLSNIAREGCIFMKRLLAIFEPRICLFLKLFQNSSLHTQGWEELCLEQREVSTGDQTTDVASFWRRGRAPRS